MRTRNENATLSVHAIAGTHVTLLGLNVKSDDALTNLIGFSIDRLDHATGQTTPLSLRPIKKFLWGDYAAQPGETYTYTVAPVRKAPGDEHHTADRDDAVQVQVTMEDPSEGTHGIYFNRGAAGSQQYSRRFAQYRRWYLVDKFGRGEQWEEYIKPELVPDNEAFQWLSRGLEEALLNFLRRASGPRYGLRMAAYELTHGPVLHALADCVERGADVKVVRHGKRTSRAIVKRDKLVLDDDGNVKKEWIPDAAASDAASAIRAVGIQGADNARKWQHDVFAQRTNTPAISHNKFVVLLEDGEPIEVWTGSTNFTSGGIFGQSNVGHVVRDSDVAAQYLAYWTKLQEDPKKARKNSKRLEDQTDMKIDHFIEHRQPDLVGPVAGPSIHVIFSPRTTTDMLEWYAARLGDAMSSVHFTAAFGVCKQIAERLNQPGPRRAEGHPFLRHILLERLPSKKKSDATKDKARQRNEPIPVDYYDFRNVSDNRIAYGDLFDERRGGGGGKEEEETDSLPLEESLSGLNTFVDYLHTKYMLLDPLTDDPTVITGSANFSDNSTDKNDENMLVIRGDKRVADIYLTEFMRLFNHFHARNNRPKKGDESSGEKDAHERGWAEDDSWVKPYFESSTQLYQERLLFS